MTISILHFLPWLFWGRLDRCFLEWISVGVYLMYFLKFIMRLWVWGEEYQRGEMPFSSHPTWGSLTSTRCHWGVDFDHLVKVMFARFLSIKVTVFVFPYAIVWQWVTKSSLPSGVGELPEVIPLPPEVGVIWFVFLKTEDHSAISDLVYNLPFLYIMWGRMCLSSYSWFRD